MTTRARRARSGIDRGQAGERTSSRVGDALYRIADAASSARDMHEFYAAMHAIVRELTYGDNFFIALFDEERQLINFAYEVDTVDPNLADPNEWFPMGEGFARGVTAYVLRTGKPTLITPERHRELQQRGEVELIGHIAGGDWLGVPLISDGRTLGVLAVQTYTADQRYTQDDVELLTFVGQHVATALSRARAIEETRQRNAELAVINSVQEALAAQLDMPAMYELVGERIREMFRSDDMYIAVLDAEGGLVTFPYEIMDGERYHTDPFPLGQGLTSIVIQSGQPLNVGTTEEANALGRIMSGADGASWLGVPLTGPEGAIGAIVLESLREHAFGDSDLRLLTTLAGTLSVALENARLFAVTKRLLAEADQRAAQLATINTVQAALASQLDLEPLIALVGEELRRTFQADIVYVALLDTATQLIEFPYYSENGHVEAHQPIALGAGLTSRILQSHEPLLLNQDAHFDALGMRGVGTLSRSFLGVPILVGEDAIGAISVQSTVEVGRFTERDAGLLAAIAASVGVAIRNARLYREQQESERQYRRMVEELPLVLYTDRPDSTSTSTYISPQVEAMFGYPRSAWLEEPFFFSILHPDDRERMTREIERGLVTSDRSISHQYRLIAADGRVVWIRDDVWVVRDEAGEPLYVQGFMMDITEQTLAAAEIRRQKAYFESLVASSPVAIVTMGPDERVTGWNPAATQLFGYTAEEAIGRPIDDLVMGGQRVAARQALTPVDAAGGETHVMTRRARKDGSLVDVELDVVPLVVDGENVGFHAIYHDVTELHAARLAAEAANQAKSTFLAAMSHEIRTPMNAIIGMSGLLLHTELDPEQRDFVETITTSGEALLTIINDILDFSKIEAGRIELESVPFALPATLEGALDVMAPVAGKKGVELAYQLDDALPRTLVGDPGRVRQIVLNLLSNALKFTAEGEVVLSASGRSLDRRGPGGGDAWEVVVEVRDTGIGIPPDRMDRLFKSFTQVDASVARRFGGTGLGLAISRRLAELMDGTLVAESTGVEGEGSTFRLAFRAEVAHETEVAPPRVGPLPALVGRRALIVDDNATNRRIVAAQIARWGIQSRDTPRPREALEWVEAGELFDIALIDLNMPEMDGYALADALRALRPVGQLPIVVLSSLGGRDREAPAIGAFLTKPVKPSSLHDALMTAFSAEGAMPRVRSAARPSLDPGLGERHRLQVLLAEDNPVNQKLAIRLLAQLGYNVDVAANGLEAIEALERRPYDLVLMDVQMPEMDGLDATRAIRARWQADGPRIVAMTANALTGDREACLAAGMDDYITKPIRVPELAGALAATPPRSAAPSSTPAQETAGGHVG